MSLLKVRGTLEEIRGSDNARLKVVSFQRNGKYIYDTDEIKNEFLPYGFVFSPHFFNEYKFDLHTLVEFGAVRNPYTIEKGDIYQLDYHTECKPFGTPIFPAPSDLFFPDTRTINQPRLKQLSINECSTFYLANGEAIYGPFKTSAGDIVPKVGREVDKYLLNEQNSCMSGSFRYLIAEPIGSKGKFDCSTNAQLSEWLKSILRTQKAGIDFVTLKKSFESLQMPELDAGRLTRCLGNIQQLSLSLQEIKTLSGLSPHYTEQFNNLLLSCKSEINESVMQPLMETKNKLENEISQLSNRKREIDKACALRLENLQAVNGEYQQMLADKMRLVADIRTHALVNQETDSDNQLKTYEVQEYFNSGLPYNSLKEAIENLERFISHSATDRFLVSKLLHQLKFKKCLLAPHVSVIQNVAAVLGNTRIILQQAEPDWLKFECLYKNGLQKIWELSYSHPENIHFFVLQDMNMASIECYGRPVLDMASGIRKKLPGRNSEWPGNLWFFGTPIKELSSGAFGLPLAEETFSDWGAFPRNIEVIDSNSNINLGVLSIEMLLDHDLIVPTPSFF